MRMEGDCPIFEKHATFIPRSILSIVAVSDDRSSRLALYTRVQLAAAPVRAIVFTSDSLSLIFNKPTRGEQIKSLIVCGAARRGAARRGPVRFRFSLSLSVRQLDFAGLDWLRVE